MRVASGIVFNRFNLPPEALLPNIIAGIIAGLVSITYCLSFAALIFSGSLAPHLSIGISSTLISATLAAIVVACRSSFAFAIAGPDSNTAAILAAMASTISAHLLAQGLSAQAAPTVWAMLVASAILSGLFLLCLSQLKLGQFIRFIPYPVIGGFLAGAGWLLIRGAFTVTSGVHLDLNNLTTLFQLSIVSHWLSSLAFAILLRRILSRYNRCWVLPALIGAGVLLTYLLLGGFGISIEQAREQGWLFADISTGEARQLTRFAFLSQINLSLLLEQTASLLGMMGVMSITLLLNATGLELTSKQDIDINQELKAAGVANLVAGIGGGMVGYLSFNRSFLNLAAGATNRLSGIIAGLVCATFLFVGPQVISYLPKPVLGGLLFYIGLSSLKEWLYDARSKLPTIEYALIVLILLVIASSGFLQGVAAGLMIACLVFAFNYSRTPLIRKTAFGANRPSNFERSFQQHKLLRQEGYQIYILVLQGYIFFGTANTFLNDVRDAILQSKVAIHYLVLNCQLVSGLDSSAASSFTKLRHFAQEQAVQLVFTHLQPDVEKQLIQSGCIKVEDGICQQFPDIDRGIEWCEDQILKATPLRRRRFVPLVLQLTELMAIPQAEIRQFMYYLDPLTISADQVLFSPGDAADSLYFLENGQISIVIKRQDDQIKRLQTLGTGTMFGEVEFYQNAPRLVMAVADKNSSLYSLSRTKLQKMQTNHPRLAAAFHQFSAYLLAERIFPSLE